MVKTTNKNRNISLNLCNIATHTHIKDKSLESQVFNLPLAETIPNKSLL